jgi:hypothetical protein
LAGETEVLGENLPQRHFVHRGGKPATNRLSYGAVWHLHLNTDPKLGLPKLKKEMRKGNKTESTEMKLLSAARYIRKKQTIY